MGKSVNIYLDLKDGVFQTPRNNAVVQLFDYPATLSDGTIFGTQAVSSDGTVIRGYQSANKGRYHFRNVVSGKYYTAVVSGGGITTFIPEGFAKLGVQQAPDVTGTDVPWKDGEVDSIATKIESITVGAVSTDNLGDGTTGIFFRQVGNELQFKDLKAGANITISNDSTSVTLSSAQDSTTNTRLSVLEASDTIQDVEIADLTASDGTQNTRLSVAENNISTNSSNISNIQVVDGTQNTRITAREVTDGTQDTRLTAVETGYAKLSVRNTFTKGQVFTPVQISALDIDWSASGIFYKTLSANSTFTFSNMGVGQVINVLLTDTTNNYTVAFPNTVRWSGGTTPTQTVGNKTDVYTFISLDGTNSYGSVVQNF